MTVTLNANRHTWTRPRPIWPKDHFKSNEYINEKPFIPSFNNRNNLPDIYMLLRWDYYRIYTKEHRNYIDERLARETKKKSKTVVRDITGLNKKKGVVDVEPKEMFKMARFKDIPAKVSHRRCIACNHKKSMEQKSGAS